LRNLSWLEEEAKLFIGAFVVYLVVISSLGGGVTIVHLAESLGVAAIVAVGVGVLHRHKTRRRFVTVGMALLVLIAVASFVTAGLVGK